MKFKLLAGAAIAASLVASGAAAQDTGWYGAVDLGYHWSDDVKFDTVLGEVPVDADDTWMGVARLGYRLSPNWRLELEGAYRPGEVPDGGLFPAGGNLEVWSLMGNVIVDFIPDGDLSPFVGVGAGVAAMQYDTSNPPFFVVDDSDATWAWQVLAGFSAKASDRVSFDVTYRYFQTGDFSINNIGAAGPMEGSFNDQSVTAGIRYSFAAPPPPPPPPVEEPPPPPPAPPPPPPPPPPAPVYEARDFIVYFPFDQSILTPEAQQVVSEAAQYAAAGGASRIVVVGHADTSGSARYNVGLSQRRAKAVADALVGLGVNSSTLSVDWKGESEPAVATGDGVKEPLNRRSTISISF
jgi:outer membrane protein OmpA-like peptidoglycan-associated protein